MIFIIGTPSGTNWAYEYFKYDKPRYKVVGKSPLSSLYSSRPIPEESEHVMRRINGFFSTKKSLKT